MISLDEEHLKKWDLIVEKEYTNRSNILRKWIDQNFKEEYNEIS